MLLLILSLSFFCPCWSLRPALGCLLELYLLFSLLAALLPPLEALDP